MRSSERGVRINPGTVYEYYRDVKGITPESTKMVRPMQHTILRYILPGASYLIVLPTGEGKTLIADLVASVYLSRGKKVLFCVPFLALMNEQYKEATKKWPHERSYVRIKRFVRGAFGCSIKNSQLIFATYERAQGILQRMLVDNMVQQNANPFSSIGLIVMDEIHTLSEDKRGQVVEWLIMMAKANGIPIIGLTGTLELEDALIVNNYIDSTLVFSDIRSVPLPIRFWFSSIDPLTMPFKDYPTAKFRRFTLVKNGDKYYDEDSKKLMSIEKDDLDFDTMNSMFKIYPSEREYMDLQKVVFQKKGTRTLLMAMVADYLQKADPTGQYQNGALIYVPTKIQINNLLNPKDEWKKINLPALQINYRAQQYRERKLTELKFKKVKLTHINEMLFPLGYAVHTADIDTNEERDLIIDLYEHHAIRIIFATSTLSAGVNLSNLSLVVITGTWRFSHKIRMNEVIQTAGRAGRSPGYPGEAWIFYNLDEDLKSFSSPVRTYTLKTSEDPNYINAPMEIRNKLIRISPSCPISFPYNKIPEEDVLQLHREAYSSGQSDWSTIKLSNQSIVKQAWNTAWRKSDQYHRAKFETCEGYGLDILDEYTSFMVLKKTLPFIRSIKCDKCCFPISSNEDNCLRVMCQLIGVYKKTPEQAYNCFLSWSISLNDVVKSMKQKGLLDEREIITPLGEDVGLLNIDISEAMQTSLTFSKMLAQLEIIDKENSSDERQLFKNIIIAWSVILCSDINLLASPVGAIAGKIANKDQEATLISHVAYQIRRLYHKSAYREFYDGIFNMPSIKEANNLENHLITRAFSFLIIWDKLTEKGINIMEQPLMTFKSSVEDITAAFIDGIRVLINYLTFSRSFVNEDPEPQRDFALPYQSPSRRLLDSCEKARASFKLLLDPYNIIIYNYLNSVNSIGGPSFQKTRLFKIVQEMRKLWKIKHRGHYDRERDVYYLAILVDSVQKDIIDLKQSFAAVPLSPDEAMKLGKMLSELPSATHEYVNDPFQEEFAKLKEKEVIKGEIIEEKEEV